MADDELMRQLSQAVREDDMLPAEMVTAGLLRSGQVKWTWGGVVVRAGGCTRRPCRRLDGG
jgi:hypothetical protein